MSCHLSRAARRNGFVNPMSFCPVLFSPFSSPFFFFFRFPFPFCNWLALDSKPYCVLRTGACSYKIKEKGEGRCSVTEVPVSLKICKIGHHVRRVPRGSQGRNIWKEIVNPEEEARIKARLRAPPAGHLRAILSHTDAL